VGIKMLKKEQLEEQITKALEEEDQQQVTKLLQETFEKIDVEEKAKEQQEKETITFFELMLKALKKLEGEIYATMLDDYYEYTIKLEEKVPENKEIEEQVMEIIKRIIIELKDKGRPRLIERMTEKGGAIAERNEKNERVQELLAEMMYEAASVLEERGHFGKVKKIKKKIKTLNEKYPENRNIQKTVIKTIIEEIEGTRKTKTEEINNKLEEIKEIVEDKGGEELELLYIKALRVAMERGKEDTKETKKLLDTMKKIAEKYTANEFHEELAKGYYNIISTMDEENQQEVSENLEEFGKLIADNKDKEIQKLYSRTLRTAIEKMGLKDYQAVEQTIEKLEKQLTDYPTNKEIKTDYFQAITQVIFKLAKEKKGKEIEPLLEKLVMMEKKYPKDEELEKAINEIEYLLKQLGYKRPGEEAKKEPKIGYL
jgi:hypothetical protein